MPDVYLRSIDPLIAIVLATFRRKISDFGIVADEVRKARPAGAAGRGILRD
jgi:hypothetical protein